jgi:hypothetical protein
MSADVAAPIAAGVTLIDFAALPLKVNMLVPSVVPLFNFTVKLDATEFAAPPALLLPA